MAESTKNVVEKNVFESSNAAENDKDRLSDNYKLKEIGGSEDVADTETEKQLSRLDFIENGAATERKLDGGDEEEVAPLEERFAKESVVTIDTTDKRSTSHRSALRAQHTYAAKKTVAQGMMDVALITANANQLRYLVEYQRNSPTFFVNVFLIVVSLLLQIAVGVSLIFKGRFDIKGKGKSPQARMINNYVVVGVFLITIINVFVASFSVTATSVPVATPLPAGPL